MINTNRTTLPLYCSLLFLNLKKNAMKKMFLLFAVLLAFSTQNNLRAQTDFDVVNFTAILQELFDITVTSGNDQTATFATAINYNDGVWELAGIASGQSVVTMEATGNWNVYIGAPDFDDGAGQAIPIANLGVWVEDQGDHTNGVEVDYVCDAAGTSQGITNALDTEFIMHGSGGDNAGDASDNTFLLHWRMGTQDGTMLIGQSMFDQMANGDFGPGTYTTVVTLTMNAAP